MSWWADDPDEIYWLEITDRDDLGADLNAPDLGEAGRAIWSYSLIGEIREGDLILHYRTRPMNVITHWSRVIGQAYADEVLWGAHGQASGRGPVAPYFRPGWRRGLEGPYPLREPVSLERLRELEPELARVRSELGEAFPRQPLYFPFQISERRPTRPAQAYLAKFPRRLLDAIPELGQLAELEPGNQPRPDSPAPAVRGDGLGTTYRRVDPGLRTARRQPFSVDPDAVDRALGAHARTQERLADAVHEAGLVPLSPAPGEPLFDLAWEADGAIVVAEVKSLTSTNEERQLRLALGQVLRYTHLVATPGRSASAVVACEREPSDSSWAELCEASGVRIVWPETFPTLFGSR